MNNTLKAIGFLTLGALSALQGCAAKYQQVDISQNQVLGFNIEDEARRNIKYALELLPMSKKEIDALSNTVLMIPAMIYSSDKAMLTKKQMHRLEDALCQADSDKNKSINEREAEQILYFIVANAP